MKEDQALQVNHDKTTCGGESFSVSLKTLTIDYMAWLNGPNSFDVLCLPDELSPLPKVLP
jgi:hypothetical protein